MDVSVTRNELEPLPEIVVAVPAAELLQNPVLAAGIWTTEAAADPKFLEQIDQHKEHTRCLREVLDSIPDPTMPLEHAIKNKFVTERQAEELYDSLSSLLSNEDYTRLVLYLPFELLPGSTWLPEDMRLKQAIENFRDSYLTAWYSQLSVQDVRANFVDGDVLETHLRTSDLPRVVKAVHLVPKLVECGMITTNDVIDLLEIAKEDQLLTSTITDALLVLDDLGFIADVELARMRESEAEEVLGAALLIKTEREKEHPQATTGNTLSISAGLEAIAREVDVAIEGQTTERRTAWLKQQKTEKAIAAMAEQVGNALLEYAASRSAIKSVLLDSGDGLAAQVFIEGVQLAIERAIISGQGDAQALYDSFKDDLRKLWDKDDPKVKERLIRSFRHLYRLGLVGKDQLSDIGISLPTLAGPLSENLALIPEELGRLGEIATSIESDPKLSSLIYPVISVGGSRLKGYGEEASDIDTAIFIRPGTPTEKAKELRELLESAYARAGLNDKPAEFWLDEVDDHLIVHNFDRTDPLLADAEPVIADSYWTHILFGAAWIGNAGAIDELRTKLLPGYFYEAPEQVFGRSARALYLERLEQDLLQYRLMHKGYARHYPHVQGLDSAYPDLVDGKSIFWDSGYRRIATQLFIHMVFLPKMKIGP